MKFLPTGISEALIQIQKELEAFLINECVKCGRLANEFRDNESMEQYKWYSLCQQCQDGDKIIVAPPVPWNV